jgi:hypothetical protein
VGSYFSRNSSIPLAESERDAARAQATQPDVEDYLASERHCAALRRHVMGLIEASRARLPGVDVPSS